MDASPAPFPHAEEDFLSSSKTLTGNHLISGAIERSRGRLRKVRLRTMNWTSGRSRRGDDVGPLSCASDIPELVSGELARTVARLEWQPWQGRRAPRGRLALSARSRPLHHPSPAQAAPEPQGGDRCADWTEAYADLILGAIGRQLNTTPADLLTKPAGHGGAPGVPGFRASPDHAKNSPGMPRSRMVRTS